VSQPGFPDLDHAHGILLRSIAAAGVTMDESDSAAYDQKAKRQKRRRLTPVWRGIIETGFILFLFYSNLLMGEFTRSNAMHGRSLVLAVIDIFTLTNLWIGTVSALIGYVVVEFLRGKI
jgi:hypothetical protein